MAKLDQGPLQPIPDHAKIVFHGILFDVHQWEQKMFDGSTATFEKLSRHDTASALAVTSDGKIILVDQEQPGMRRVVGLPGGRVDTGETVLASVQREFLEETGYKADDWILWLSGHPSEKINYTAYTYVARNARQVVQPLLDSGEKGSVQLLSFDEFVALMLDDTYRDDEVALVILRAKADPHKFAELKRILGL